MIHYNDNLTHHGVKGMKWGRRKDKKKYISNNKADIAIYGQRGANRIKKRMQSKGMSRKKAERRETIRSAATVTAVSVGAMSVMYPSLAKFMTLKTVQLAGKGVGKIGKSFVNATGGYSYKNAAKYVAMNLKNKARGVSYL